MIRRIAAALAALDTAGAFAQGGWPQKPVKLMVGASPGGGTDIIARMLGEKYQQAFGQPFVVENRPGAANTIASDVTAKAPPDGYTLLVGTNTAQAIAPHIMKLGFDPVKDLAPIALIVVVPNVVLAGPAVKAGTIAELVAEL
jgi:tripartite-type tricarboxylate transporter receptor subunit TctC